MKLLIGTLEVVAVDDKTSLAKVSSTEPMKTLALDFKRFLVGDAAAPALKLNSAVMFAAGQATLTPGAAQELQKAAKQIQAINPREIVIEGHTDNVGDPKANYQLSVQRAEAVKAFLVRQGIPDNTVKTQGFGDTRPVAPNDTEENKQKNRRIEVVFWE
jgi:outer membrane protein OmpA-like peptidoglycan-associated protein